MEFFPQPVDPVVPCQQMMVFAEGLNHPEMLAFDDEGALWDGGEAGQIHRIGRNLLVANLGCWHITRFPPTTPGQLLATLLAE
jgi:hypothetical protein